MSAEAATNGAVAAGASVNPAGGQPTPPPAGGAPAPSAPWYGDLSADPELKGYVELKNFKTPLDALKHARDTERFVGAPKEELIRLSKEPKPEEMSALYDRLGRPAKPDDYKFEVVPGTEAFEKLARPALHALGLSQDQAAGLQKFINAHNAEQAATAQNARQQQEQADVQDLHREWPGNVYAEREQMGRTALNQFIVPFCKDAAEAQEVVGKIEDAIGTARVLKLFSNIGEKLGEGKMVGDANGRRPEFGMTPAAAGEQKRQNMTNPEWSKRALIKGSPESIELDRLQRLEASGM